MSRNLVAEAVLILFVTVLVPYHKDTVGQWVLTALENRRTSIFHQCLVFSVCFLSEYPQ